jgi:uncharacterized protein
MPNYLRIFGVPDVISNTSPLQYLHQIGLLDLLPTMYGKVIVPAAVIAELAEGRKGGISLPEPELLTWAEVRSAKDQKILPAITGLGPGEREAISLGTELPNSLLILDDQLARRHAALLGMNFTGTLGILLKAKTTGRLNNIASVLDRFEACRFWLRVDTRAAVLKIAGEPS